MVQEQKYGISTEIELPDGVEFRRENDKIHVKGEKGESNRTLVDRSIFIDQENGKLTLGFMRNTRKQKRKLNTTAAHIRNMVKGVTEGYTYKLKICSGHFPMNVALKGDIVEVKNFVGEKVPRTLKINQNVEVKIEGEEITVTSPNKEEAGQAAGSLEKLTRRSGFDKRIFQDGIYITEKPKRYEE